MPITASEWYDNDPDPKNLHQGDVLDGVPIVFTQKKGMRWVLLRPLPTGPLEGARSGLPRRFVANADGELPTAWAREDGELVMAAAAVYRIIILSRSCNLDWKKQVQVAPVYPVHGLGETQLATLRENDDESSFYLPGDGEDMVESYADLGLIATVSISYLARTDNLKRRLSPQAMVELQNSLASYYARAFGFDIRDNIPQEGTYRCTNCFFTGEPKVPLQRLNTVGQKFPECPACKADALWVKIPDLQQRLF